MKLEKQIFVDELLERIQASPYLLVFDYQGLTVDGFEELRKRLKEVGAKGTVAKNRLVKRSLQAGDFPDLSEAFVGQTMIVTGEGEIPAAAKVLKNFTAEFKKPVFKAGVLDGDVIDESQLKALAELPSREELLAKLLSVINAPASKLVRTINEPAGSLARVLQAFADKG
ncbi:50S ribosomal protein L10 [Sulfuriroseicoccus oceanibius]|uniref:Large ribosomal subunit protein uL10 n=1 Tax=Sulfuriroseicoccus oceanibius TaxID=2707525 RepID=A0A6B3LGH8_9BACT|nr:50S ribosomal protein L10 [Sulfuriroseicoccus oceanibius]QQL45765.1 50S ribosomal protein L10 [Sulfuriroseicoccus oceanibius]